MLAGLAARENQLDRVTRGGGVGPRRPITAVDRAGGEDAQSPSPVPGGCVPPNRVKAARARAASSVLPARVYALPSEYWNWGSVGTMRAAVSSSRIACGTIARIEIQQAEQVVPERIVRLDGHDFLRVHGTPFAESTR